MTDESVFAAALAIPDEADRAAFLDRACAGNPGLRKELDELLAAHGRAGSFLARPAAGLPPTSGFDPGPEADSCAEGPGSCVGPYKLLQQIGEGGMGTVYMAEQGAPVRRTVAVKIIKPGMDSKAVLARFEAERQALALMDHPNIAKVLEAGTTPAGRPYFVMELVRGVPITQFCDEHQLSPRQRLELFVPVCRAVQHAHQKGVIHRDLKPSNVLVALYDDRPVPKVIDFGVAKATGERLTERTLFTAFGSVVGTLEYMSPEQARLNALDIDTRSDVYSLGVLLYELLTGTTPISRERLKQSAMDEVLRLIREEEPPRPSARLTTSAELPALAARRGTEPQKLGRLVQGELDWIVMRALEKDRSRRYESAGGLANDVERYLRDEPVEACPPSAGYRLRKAFRKNRRLVVTAGSFVAVVVGAGVMGALLAVEARRAQRAAERDRDQVALAEREAAGQRDAALAEQKRAAASERAAAQARDTTAQVLDFLEKRVFGAARPKAGGGLGRDISVRAALAAAEPHIERDFRGQPLVEARVCTAVGEMYLALGDPRMAESLIRRARELFAAHGAPASRDGELQELDIRVAELLLTADRGTEGAYDLLLDLSDPEMLARIESTLADTLLTLAFVDRTADPSRVRTFLTLAEVQFKLGKWADAKASCRECLKILDRLEWRNRMTGHARSLLGAALLKQGRYAEAEPELLAGQELVAADARNLPPERAAQHLFASVDRLVALYAAWGKPADAAKWAAIRPPEPGPEPREVKP